MNYEKLDQIKALIDEAEWFRNLEEGELSMTGEAHYAEIETQTDALIRAWGTSQPAVEEDAAELACPKCGHIVGCLAPLCDFKSKVTA